MNISKIKRAHKIMLAFTYCLLNIVTTPLASAGGSRAQGQDPCKGEGIKVGDVTYPCNDHGSPAINGTSRYVGTTLCGRVSIPGGQTTFCGDPFPGRRSGE